MRCRYKSNIALTVVFAVLVFGGFNSSFALYPYNSLGTIIVTKTEHLDADRQFISDIHTKVMDLDGIWSEIIPDSHHIRVTFERDLTSNNDITIYPKVISGNPRIEIYEKDGTKLIAEFTSIKSNQYNKVFLAGLQGSQDTFDLRVLGGSIQLDNIVDPWPMPWYVGPAK